MNKNKKNNNTYSMPVKFNPKNHVMFIIQVIYFNLGAFAFDYIFLFYKDFMKNLDKNTVLLIVPLIFLFSFYALYLTIDLVDSVTLNKQYVKINYDGDVHTNIHTTGENRKKCKSYINKLKVLAKNYSKDIYAISDDGAIFVDRKTNQFKMFGNVEKITID